MEEGMNDDKPEDIPMDDIRRIPVMCPDCCGSGKVINKGGKVAQG